MGIRECELKTTRRAHLDDTDLLDEFAARSLDLLALPAALATNTRLLDGEVEIPKQRWSTSRVGDGQVVHTELRNPHIDQSVIDGGMVVIDSIDEVDMVLMRLREALEYRLSARAWINLYMTAGSTSNFGLHYDTFDTLIIQLLGRKAWLVGDHSKAPGAVVDPADQHGLHRVELAVGDVLVMPARVLHNATGLNVFTMHLTIGFDRTAAVPWLVRDVDSLLGRARTPISDSALEQAKARVTERRRGTSLPFAESWDMGPRVRVRWATRLRPIADGDADSTLRVTSGTHSLTFTKGAAAIVHVLIAGDEHGVDDLAAVAGVSRDETERVVRELAALDLVICRYVSRYP